MGILRLIGAVVVIIWLLGFVLRVGGGMIHLLLVVAAIIFIFDFVFGRRRL